MAKSETLRDKLKRIEEEYTAARNKAPAKVKGAKTFDKAAARAKEIMAEAKPKATEKKPVAKPLTSRKKASAAVIDLEGDAETPLPTNQVMLQLDEMVQNVEQLDKQIEEANTKIQQLSEHRLKLVEVDIPELMKTANAISLTMTDGTVVNIDSQIYPGYKAEDQDKLFEWLRKNNFGSIIKNVVSVNFGKGEDAAAAKLIAQLNKMKLSDWGQKESIHASTFKAFVREQVEMGTKLPKLISIFNKSVAQIKRSKNGNEKATGSKANRTSKEDKF